MVGKANGIFPERKGGEAGGHALAFIGWDDDKQILECLHSWKDAGWPKLGGISYNYFKYGSIEYFTVLDSEEADLAQGIFSVLEITSNVDVTLKVVDCDHPSGVDYKSTRNVKVSVDRGSDYTVVATPSNPALVVEPNLTVSGKALAERIQVPFKFTLKASPPPDDLMKKIIELLKKF